MLYKIIGVTILLVAGGYVSLGISGVEKRRMGVLDGYISLLFYIKGQIGCYAMPMEQIMAHADPALLAACLGQPTRVGEEAVLISAPTLDGMIRDSRAYLEPESERLLTTFSSELGKTFREEQLLRCDYYIEALGEERKKLAESLPGRIRMNSVLCLCCLLGVAVLLW